MSEYTMQLVWQRQAATFSDNRYSRAHTWQFDGGVRVPASSSPHVVPVPFSEPANVDPEEAYVAALASCHLLTFLWLAARQGLVVDAYTDEPIGVMAPNEQGRPAITHLTLRPRVRFASTSGLDEAVVTQLHHTAHEQCYLANSVKTTIEVQSQWEVASAADN